MKEYLNGKPMLFFHVLSILIYSMCWLPGMGSNYYGQAMNMGQGLQQQGMQLMNQGQQLQQQLAGKFFFNN